jgi:crossover junction endodeoxyribonuclease RuvC
VLSPPKGWAGMTRLKWILDSVWNLTEHADLVVIENYAFDRPNQAHQIGELGGIIRFTLWEAGKLYVEIAPSSMKKFATGTGNASKDEVLVAAVKKLGYQGFSKDQADALWLLDMAIAHYEKRACTAKQVEAIEKIDWPALTGSLVAGKTADNFTSAGETASHSSTSSDVEKQEALGLVAS